MVTLKNSVYHGEYKTILEALKGERVFSIAKNETGDFDIEEECDNCFGGTLTKDQMVMLINELTRLVE